MKEGAAASFAPWEPPTDGAATAKQRCLQPRSPENSPRAFIACSEEVKSLKRKRILLLVGTRGKKGMPARIIAWGPDLGDRSQAAQSSIAELKR